LALSAGDAGSGSSLWISCIQTNTAIEGLALWAIISSGYSRDRCSLRMWCILIAAAAAMSTEVAYVHESISQSNSVVQNSATNVVTDGDICS